MTMDRHKTLSSRCNLIKIWNILKFRYILDKRERKKIKILFLNAQVSLNNLIDYDNIEALMAEAINSLKNCRLER